MYVHAALQRQMWSVNTLSAYKICGDEIVRQPSTETFQNILIRFHTVRFVVIQRTVGYNSLTPKSVDRKLED